MCHSSERECVSSMVGMASKEVICSICYILVLPSDLLSSHLSDILVVACRHLHWQEMSIHKQCVNPGPYPDWNSQLHQDDTHHHSQTRLPPFCPKVPAVSCTNVSHRLGSAWWCQWAVKGEGKILMLFGVWCQMIIVFTFLWVTLMRFWPLTSLIIMLPSNYCRSDFYNSMIYIHICELWFFVGMKNGIQTCQHMSLQLSEWKRVTRLSLANAGWTSL